MANLLSTFRELGRLRQIYVVLVRHGFADVARRLGLGAKPKGASEPPQSSEDPELAQAEARGKEEAKSPLAERVRLVAMDLGPSFVKLGQIASTRTDVLPSEWTFELKKLQDEVSPLPFEKIAEAIEVSLGAPLDTFYETIEEKPLAAASIGQVHRARLKSDDGALDVVIKVQRPGIRATVTSDLDLLHHLARLIERTIPESGTYNPVGLVEQFDRAITAELDFTLEAAFQAGNAADVIYADASGSATKSRTYAGQLYFAQAGYKVFDDLRAGVQAFYTPGTSDRTGSTIDTFQTLPGPRFGGFPYLNTFNGISENMGMKNLFSPSVSLYYEGGKWGDFLVNYFYEMKATPQDAWYAISGVANTGASSESATNSKTGLSRNLYQEIDLVWMKQFSTYFSIWIGVGYLHAGDAIAAARGGDFKADAFMSFIQLSGAL